MAIKPNDCVIRIADLVVGTKEVRDSWNGKTVEVDRYEKYWENFNDHVHKLAREVDISNWRDWRTTPANIVYEQELKKFHAVHKETKNWQDRYIKFKSHKHLTMFVLKWS
jgi:hypothetical protein